MCDLCHVGGSSTSCTRCGPYGVRSPAVNSPIQLFSEVVNFLNENEGLSTQKPAFIAWTGSTAGLDTDPVHPASQQYAYTAWQVAIKKMQDNLQNIDSISIIPTLGSSDVIDGVKMQSDPVFRESINKQYAELWRDFIPAVFLLFLLAPICIFVLCI